MELNSWKFRTVRTLMQRGKIDNSLIEDLSTIKIFPMPTLIEEIKPVVLVENKFENQKNLKLNFFKVSDYQDTDAREKNNEFSVEQLSTSAVFSIKFLSEEVERVMAES